MQTEVHSLRSLQPDYFIQRFISPPLAFQPGQFVMVKPSGSLDPFLPRAYSILRVRHLMTRSRGKRGSVVEIFYKVMGKGSRTLARLRPGDRVDLLGPLGNGYRLPASLTTVLLVAGGIGVPPVVALAERLAISRSTVHGSQDENIGRGSSDFGHRSSVIGRRSPVIGRRSPVIGRQKMVAFVGGKTSNDVFCLTDLRKAGASVRVATEDGSLGRRGFVTHLLEEYLQSTDNCERSAIYACGPHPMLHAVARIAQQLRVPCQLSLEADMACGFGACVGCVLPVQSSGFIVHGPEEPVNREPSTVNERSYKLCCKDGPVFDAREIAW